MPRLKLTSDMINDIVRYIERGAYMVQAAIGLGVARSTIYDWREKGRVENERRCSGFYDTRSLFDESENSIYLQLYLKTERANLELFTRLSEKLLNASSIQKHWQPQFRLMVLRFQNVFNEYGESGNIDNTQSQIGLDISREQALEILAESKERLREAKQISQRIDEAKVTIAEVVE